MAPGKVLSAHWANLHGDVPSGHFIQPWSPASRTETSRLVICNKTAVLVVVDTMSVTGGSGHISQETIDNVREDHSGGWGGVGWGGGRGDTCRLALGYSSHMMFKIRVVDLTEHCGVFRRVLTGRRSYEQHTGSPHQL